MKFHLLFDSVEVERNIYVLVSFSLVVNVHSRDATINIYTVN